MPGGNWRCWLEMFLIRLGILLISFLVFHCAVGFRNYLKCEGRDSGFLHLCCKPANVEVGMSHMCTRFVM